MFRELTENELYMVANILLDLKKREKSRDVLAKVYDDSMSDLPLATDILVTMNKQLDNVKLDNGNFKAMHANEVLETYSNLSVINVQQSHVKWLGKRYDEAMLDLAYYENKLYDIHRRLDNKLKEVQA